MNIEEELKEIDSLVEGRGQFKEEYFKPDHNWGILEIFLLLRDEEGDARKEGMVKAGKVYAPILKLIRDIIERVLKVVRAEEASLTAEAGKLFAIRRSLEEKLQLARANARKRLGVSDKCLSSSMTFGCIGGPFGRPGQPRDILGDWLFGRRQKKRREAFEAGFRNAVDKIWNPKISSIKYEIMIKLQDCSNVKNDQVSIICELYEEIARLTSELKMLKEI